MISSSPSPLKQIFKKKKIPCKLSEIKCSYSFSIQIQLDPINVRFSCCSDGQKPTCAGLQGGPTWLHSIRGALLCGVARNSNRSRGSVTRGCSSLTSHLAKGILGNLLAVSLSKDLAALLIDKLSLNCKMLEYVMVALSSLYGNIFTFPFSFSFNQVFIIF